MARGKSPPKKAVPAKLARPAVPVHYDKYLAVTQAIYRDPIELIEDLRGRTILRGDGSTGPMTFHEIAEIITELAKRHADAYEITPVTISYEAVRRWWRHFHPEEPTRQSRKSGPAALTIDELAVTDALTAAKVRAELGL